MDFSNNTDNFLLIDFQIIFANKIEDQSSIYKSSQIQKLTSLVQSKVNAIILTYNCTVPINIRNVDLIQPVESPLKLYLSGMQRNAEE